MSNAPIKAEQDCTHCHADAKKKLPIIEDQPSSKVGLAITICVGTAAIGLVCVTMPFVAPAFRKHALPYIPATDKQVSNVFKAIRQFESSKNVSKYVPNTSNHPKLIDLGSGDGRIVFEAAKQGYKSEGVELNSMLVLYSKFKALSSWSMIQNAAAERDLPVSRPQIHRADFWKINMKEYDLIVVFGVQEMMKDLATKLKKEMKPDCLIVSCRSPITEYKSIFHLDEELDSIWIYDKNSLFVSVDADQKEKLNYKQKKNDDDDDDLM